MLFGWLLLLLIVILNRMKKSIYILQYENKIVYITTAKIVKAILLTHPQDVLKRTIHENNH